MMEKNSLLTPSMASSPPSLFSVKFFDGERELDMGTVPITPSLTFKSFQSILSQKLQRSPHQITIYFERQKLNNNHGNFHHIHHHRQRYPVTSKFDFGSVMSESDSAFFWVVQKRSRRTRRRKPKLSNHILNNGNINSNFMLLRRDCNELEYLRMMQMKSQQQQQCERYLMSLNLNSNVYDDLSSSFYGNSGFGGGYNCNFSDDGASSSGGGSSIDYGVGRVVGGFCDVCYQNAVMGETAAFHWCKNDAVTQVYRSPAGPIGPPKKKK